MAEDKKELCSITVVLPVESDEQAMDVKKKVQAAIADNPEAVVDFRLRSLPSKPT